MIRMTWYNPERRRLGMLSSLDVSRYTLQRRHMIRPAQHDDLTQHEGPGMVERSRLLTGGQEVRGECETQPGDLEHLQSISITKYVRGGLEVDNHHRERDVRQP